MMLITSYRNSRNRFSSTCKRQAIIKKIEGKSYGVAPLVRGLIGTGIFTHPNPHTPCPTGLFVNMLLFIFTGNPVNVTVNMVVVHFVGVKEMEEVRHFLFAEPG